MHAYVSCMYADDPSLLDPPPTAPSLSSRSSQGIELSPCVLSSRFPVGFILKSSQKAFSGAYAGSKKEMEKNLENTF